MDQSPALPLDGRHNPGMGVPHVRDCDSCGEIEKPIAVHILDHRPPSTVDDERVDARVGRRHDAVVAFQPGRAPGPRQRAQNPRIVAMKRDHGIKLLLFETVPSSVAGTWTVCNCLTLTANAIPGVLPARLLRSLTGHSQTDASMRCSTSLLCDKSTPEFKSVRKKPSAHLPRRAFGTGGRRHKHLFAKMTGVATGSRQAGAMPDQNHFTRASHG